MARINCTGFRELTDRGHNGLIRRRSLFAVARLAGYRLRGLTGVLGPVARKLSTQPFMERDAFGTVRGDNVRAFGSIKNIKQGAAARTPQRIPEGKL
jgi:hypothetical protein